MNMYHAILSSFTLVLAAGPALVAAEPLSIPVHKVSTEGLGASVGSVEFSDSAEGLVIAPMLEDLPPGPHGFHIHERPTCEPAEKDGKLTAAQAAGDHWDPKHSGRHAGPAGGGHAGDLPLLEVAPDGTARSKLVVAGLSVSQIRGRSLMIHEGGDNYSDTPKPLGGGGARIACGVIPAA